MKALVRIADGVMAVVFAFAAAVQYNDPDPLRWMAVYGLAMLACGLAVAGQLPRLLPALVGLGAVLWAGTLAPGVVGRVSVGELFQSFGMLTPAVEEGREMGGLLIVAVWMGVLTLVRAGRAA